MAIVEMYKKLGYCGWGFEYSASTWPEASAGVGLGMNMHMALTISLGDDPQDLVWLGVLAHQVCG